MTSTDESALTAEQIRERLNEIAPYSPGDPVTAVGLARQQAIEAQIAWARMMDTDTPITMRDIALVQGCFGTARALLALAEADPAGADEVAAQIRNAFEDGGDIGEWLWQIHGEHAREISALATQLAVLAAKDGA
jgi:hypothetical protein